MARNQQKQQREASEFEERVVFINRVAKTVKGGRRMSLVALVVVGDGKGNVGLGMGKSAEVPLAISKASIDAKKNMFHVPVTAEGTIPHDVQGEFGAASIIMRPAVEGTGVIAGGAVRPLFELAGIKNILSKSLGSDNGLNIIKAAAEGLKQLSSPRGCRRPPRSHRLRDVHRQEGELGMATIKIKQVRSINGCKEDQRRTVRALGLHRINDTREIADNESVRGMIFKVKHLVEIVEE